jgi:hypothetical protein
MLMLQQWQQAELETVKNNFLIKKGLSDGANLDAGIDAVIEYGRSNKSK